MLAPFHLLTSFMDAAPVNAKLETVTGAETVAPDRGTRSAYQERHQPLHRHMEQPDEPNEVELMSAGLGIR